MTLNQIKKQISIDSEVKLDEIKKIVKQETNEIIKQANDQANQILEKSKIDLNQEIKQVELEYNSQIEFEKNQSIIIEKESILNKISKDLKQIFIKQINNQTNKLLDSAIHQISETLSENNIFIDLNKNEKNINFSKLKKYKLKYINQDNIIIHNKEYDIQIEINSEKLFEDNIDLVKYELSKYLFKEEAASKKSAKSSKK